MCARPLVRSRGLSLCVHSQSVLDSVGGQLDGGQKQSDGSWRCWCPVHRGRSQNSLALALGKNGSILVHCHAGCDWRAVQASIERTTGVELWVACQPSKRSGDSLLCEYAYSSGSKKRVYRTVCTGVACAVCDREAIAVCDRRVGEKHVRGKGSNEDLHVVFWQAGRWTNEPDHTKASFKWQLYGNEDGLPVVLLCEGEKAACFASEALPLVAASWCGGTSSADKFLLERLAGCFVVVLLDRDQAGQDAAKVVAARFKEAYIPHVVLMEAGGDGADAADFDRQALRRRLALIRGWQARRKKHPPDISGEDKDAGVMPHPPLKPLVVHDGFLERIEHLRHTLGQGGIEVRMNGRTRALEYRTRRAPTWQEIKEGWLEYHLPRSLRRLVQRVKGVWREGHLPKAAAGDELLALAFESDEQGSNDDVLTWLEGLPAWDMQERIETFLQRAFGAEDTPLNRWASASIFVQIVRRTLYPGCEWRGIPVLVGPQNTGKSRMVMYLLPEHLRAYHMGDLHLDDDAKTRTEKTLGKAVVELPEMAGRTHAQRGKLKAWVTQLRDRVRLSYRRNAEDVDRCWAAVGTMNDKGETIPRDPSGSSRWVFVRCPHACHVQEWMTDSEREQMFAEAMLLSDSERYRYGIDRSLMDAQAEANAEFEDEDTDLLIVVEDCFHGTCPDGSTLLEFAQEAGLVPRYYDDRAQEPVKHFADKGLETRFGSEMHRRFSSKRASVNGVRAVRWYRKQGEEPDRG